MDHGEVCERFKKFSYTGPIMQGEAHLPRVYSRKYDQNGDTWYLAMSQNPGGLWFLEEKINFCPFCGESLYEGKT